MICSYYSVEVQKTKKSSLIPLRYFLHSQEALSFFSKYSERDGRKSLPSYRISAFRIDVYEDFIRRFDFAVKIRLPKRYRECPEELPF